MNFFDLIHARRSIRAYKTIPVEEEKLTRILETANAAPSAGNLQSYLIQIIRDQETKEALVKASLDQKYIAQAPVVLAFFAQPEIAGAKYHNRGRDLYALQDATIACAYAQLAATELGLATVWIGAFDDLSVKRALKAPEQWRPAALLPIGYADEQPAPTRRRALSDLIRK